jgi:hypothetical protein
MEDGLIGWTAIDDDDDDDDCTSSESSCKKGIQKIRTYLLSAPEIHSGPMR